MYNIYMRFKTNDKKYWNWKAARSLIICRGHGCRVVAGYQPGRDMAEERHYTKLVEGICESTRAI